VEAKWNEVETVETVPLEERFESIPSVVRVKAAMLKSEASREAVEWGAADFSRLSAKHVDAIHEIVSSLRFNEAHGGIIGANLANRIPYRDISEAYTVQMLDESHHTWLLTRYETEELRRPSLRVPFVVGYANWQLSHMRDPLICAMAGSHFIETGAAEVQTELIAKVDEPLLVHIFSTIHRDEMRHIVLGREAVRFLLDRPPYKTGWRRERGRMYRHFLEFYSRLALGRFRKAAQYFGIDVDRIRTNTLARVREAVPL